MMQDLKEKLQELKVKKEELKKQMIEASQDVFKQGMNQIFEKHSVLESFGWTQYTPYFNDGDTCYFNVYIDEPYINGEYGEELDCLSKKNISNYGTWNREKKIYEGRVEVDNPNYNKELSEAYDDVYNFLNMFDEDYFLDAFGDHVQITVKKDGTIDTEECEHD
jgi:hypothetical protein